MHAWDARAWAFWRDTRHVPGSAVAWVLATQGRVSMRVSPTTLPVGWPFLARPVFFFFSALRLRARVSRRRVLDPRDVWPACPRATALAGGARQPRARPARPRDLPRICALLRVSLWHEISAH